jgi:hypothetical protein
MHFPTLFTAATAATTALFFTLTVAVPISLSEAETYSEAELRLIAEPNAGAKRVRGIRYDGEELRGIEVVTSAA